MLVLTRKLGEKVVVEEQIEVVVLEIRAGQVKLGFNAPRQIVVNRAEIHERILRERAATAEEPGACA